MLSVVLVALSREFPRRKLARRIFFSTDKCELLKKTNVKCFFFLSTFNQMFIYKEMFFSNYCEPQAHHDTSELSVKVVALSREFPRGKLARRIFFDR